MFFRPESRCEGAVSRATWTTPGCGFPLTASIWAPVADTSTAGAVSILVSVVDVRCRATRSQRRQIGVIVTRADTPEPRFAKLESGLGASPRGSESRILRHSHRRPRARASMHRVGLVHRGIEAGRSGSPVRPLSHHVHKQTAPGFAMALSSRSLVMACSADQPRPSRPRD